MFRRKEDMHDARMNIAGRADLAGLPPTTIILAEPIRCAPKARRWPTRCAVPASGSTMTLYQGVTHGFFGLHQVVNKAMFAQGQMARNLSAAFGGCSGQCTDSVRASIADRRHLNRFPAMVRPQQIPI